MATIIPTVDQVGDATLTNSIIDKSITTLQDELVTELPGNVFESCVALKKAVFGSVTTVGNYAFGNCSALEIADFHADNLSISSNAFYNCTALSALIMRSGTLSTLNNTNAFQNTGIANGTGYIYVPASLVDTYKADSSWNNYANRFRAIEDYPALCSDLGKIWTQMSSNPRHVTFENGLYVGAGYGLFYSEDGFTWQAANVTSANYWKPQYANGIWITGGSASSTGVFYSTDGKKWTRIDYNFQNPTVAAYGNGKWMISGSDSAYNGLVYVSTDGVTWTLIEGVNCPRAEWLVYHEGVWVASGRYCGVRYSEDGATWITAASGNHTVQLLQANGMVVCADENGNIRSSINGKTWSTVRRPVTNLQCFSYTNGLFFVSGYGAIYCSTDCRTWTLHSTLDGIFCGPICYVDGLWVMCSGANKKGVYFSLDGVTWEISNVTNVSVADANAFVYRNGKLLLYASQGGGHYSVP